ncbi:hypothetical protein PPROV_001099300 [Pycnococcus provasolii]|uniref:Ionotropic glutamate receptor C-terminal domain-containing protein n=1 Tax=Pycnococcus provasolii TaxID=41880 RepID=A0A830I064_9CHLO|nr:hypothetical protein PPROV_001099300 [Pycnococcus provasolii]
MRLMDMLLESWAVFGTVKSTERELVERVVLTGKAAQADGSKERPWQVGMMTYSPFVINATPPGGYVIDYLSFVKKLIESQTGVPFHMEYTLQNVRGGNGALRSMENGTFNFVISGITITPTRERTLSDFGEAHFPAGTGMVVRRPEEIPYMDQVLSTFTSQSAARNLAMLAFLSLVFANLVYFAERNSVNEDFTSDDYAGGLTRAVWFSFVTVTTTGFGDIVPLTRQGRVVATVWMGVGLIIMSIFSADVLSRLTAHRVHDGITGPDSLRGRVCVVSDGTPWVEMCGSWGATVKKTSSGAESRKMLMDGLADVWLSDWPVQELWLLESQENKRKFHMPWRSIIDGPFGPGFPHLAHPMEKSGAVNQTVLDVYNRHYRMRELLNLGILYMKGSNDEAQLMAKYFGGLSLSSLGSGGGSSSNYDIVPATVDDPYIILGIFAVVLYVMIITTHAFGYRIRTDTIYFFEKKEELEVEDDDDPLNAGNADRRNGLARAQDVMRLERRVDRMWRLIESMDKRMVDRGMLPERVIKGEEKVRKVVKATQFVKVVERAASGGDELSQISQEGRTVVRSTNNNSFVRGSINHNQV